MRKRYYIPTMIVLFLTGLFIGVDIARKPLPIFDDGHAFIGVVNEEALKIVLEISEENGIGPLGTFKIGGITQTILKDGDTAYGYFKDIGDMPENGKSYRVKDPMFSALRACEKLQKKGFSAEIYGEVFENIVVVKSDAFINSSTGLVFTLKISGLFGGKHMPEPEWIPNPK